MKKFYLTFGANYAYEKHPSGAHVHPDGYVVITAEDYDIARDVVTQLYGVYWSDLYSAKSFDLTDMARLFPRGSLLNIQVPDGEH